MVDAALSVAAGCLGQPRDPGGGRLQGYPPQLLEAAFELLREVGPTAAATRTPCDLVLHTRAVAPIYSRSVIGRHMTNSQGDAPLPPLPADGPPGARAGGGGRRPTVHTPGGAAGRRGTRDAGGGACTGL
jgi:hypothetical protein